MKIDKAFFFTASVALLLAVSVTAGEVDDLIADAKDLADGGDPLAAMALLEEAAPQHPEDSDLLAYLGLYTGMSAGRTQNFDEAGRLLMLSFERLDKAVKLDGSNPEAWLFRGIIGINVPGFFGRLEAGISDLEKAAELYSASDSGDARSGLLAALTNLAEGYATNGDPAGQKKTLEKIVLTAPGSEAAEAAEAKIAELGAVEPKPVIDPSLFEPLEGDDVEILDIKEALRLDHSDPTLLLQLGTKYYEEESYSRAHDVLKAYTGLVKTDPEAYRMLALSTAFVAERGYDGNIHDDTDYMSNLAFEIMAAWDKAVDLSPDDLELRLARGQFGLLLPFFLGKYDQSVEDLRMVASSDESTDGMKSEALYYLGYASERKALTDYIKVVKDFPGTEGAKMALERMRPHVPRPDESAVEKPYVKIDFVLGFQDQMAPQTAVWVEDENENHIRTLYVSGFAGYAKEKQVTLPLWAAVTKFEGIDGVTSASIDVGHYIYFWDLKDYNGRKVGKGRYRIRVETSYWPSNLYQNVEAFIEVGGKENSVRVEEGDFIPFLEVSYVK
jgi:hypothetical protein